MIEARSRLLQHLAGTIRGLERAAEPAGNYFHISSSIQALDEVLPGGGLPLGTLIEVLAEPGCGALTLSLRLARQAVERAAVWAVVDLAGTFYPPAAPLESQKLVLIRPQPQNAAWTMAQLLRCPDVGASFLTLSAQNKALDSMSYRRLQLSAERGRSLGFVIRPMDALRKPCWAALRLCVSRAADRLRVTILHARGAHVGAEVDVQ